ncbi:hypothetical protein [Winogradskyella sp.]|jgi:L-rhamnose isomerase|uniref:hypothetical protein n=1 Tax=Winogradskyella sp. TaxID=1883156 RepID=UPI0025FE306A|nr:hypothetical protein [Winogradskyella sp.]MCT4629477.1 hypothetical protein [Winogradskyella sp.]
MKKYRYTKDIEGGKNFESEEILLEYFINDFDKYMLEDYLPEIEAVANGEKVFNEIKDFEGIWSFGAEAGYFNCDTEKAYFIVDEEGHHPNAPNIEMPIQELIDILKDWQKFLEK